MANAVLSNMESVKAAISELENGLPSPRERGVAGLDASTAQLSTIETILKLSTISPLTFKRLAEALRTGLQPLYTEQLQLTLRLSLSIFQTIQDEKINQLVGNGHAGIKEGWEMSQAAIIAGILDYLEEDSTVKAKTAVATAFQSLLCRLYFSSTRNDRIEGNSDLLTSVYMLLSDIASGNAEVASNLRRATLLGGTRLGFTIWNTREFLPLEALLELFANLLPSAKGTGKEKRLPFIQQVFNPSIFACSSKIVDVLQSGKTWDDIGTELMDSLASANLAFPQPFQTAFLTIGKGEEKATERIYVDSKVFLMNVQEGESLDVLTIDYNTVIDIEMTPSLGKGITVNVSLTRPPLIGKNMMEASQRNHTAHWVIKNTDKERFISALKERGLSVKQTKEDYSRKLSIAKQIALDGTKNASPPRTTQEKVSVIKQLWDQSTPGEHHAASEDSLPVGSILPPASGELLLRSAEKPPQTLFIDNEGNLSAVPAKAVSPAAKLKTEKGEGGKTVPKSTLPLATEPNVQPLKSGKRSNPVILLSDDEVDEGGSPEFTPSPAPKRPKKALPKVAPTPPSEPKTRQAKRKALENLRTKENLQTGQVGAARDGSPCLEGKKRKLDEPATAETPVKRLRSSDTPDVQKENFIFAPVPLRANARFTVASKKPQDRPKPTLATPATSVPRKAAMKNRAGKAKEMKQPTRASNRAKAASEKKQPAIKVKLEVQDDSAPLLLPESEDTIPPKAERVRGRRQVDVKQEVRDEKVRLTSEPGSDHLASRSHAGENAAKTSSKLAAQLKDFPSRQQRKKKKAPWESDSFIQKIKQESTPEPFELSERDRDLERPSMEVLPKEPVESIPALEQGSSDDYEGDTKTFVEEYMVPTKTGNSSPDIILSEINQPERPETPKDMIVTMIDLTHSPTPEKQAVVAKPKPKPKRLSEIGIQAGTTSQLELMKHESPLPARPVCEKQEVVPPSPPAARKADTLKVPVPKVTFQDLPKPAMSEDPAGTRSKLSVDGDQSRKRDDVSPFRTQRHEERSGTADRHAKQRQAALAVLEAEQANEAVIEALNKIHNELIKAVIGRFDSTSQEARRSKMSILRSAAEHLEVLRIDSARHFNAFVDLEADYAARRKKISDEIESFQKAGNRATNAVKAIIKTHNQNGLSKKFPTSLFPKPFSAKAHRR
ncbi:hypothetical protein CC2G_005980 [Coprinopsis cinerea AmutBmut pab1-1]|nr:hypothetical protein CC2G_005980 [Coprinopsis cinerea AmutBmut pab1-1]